MPTTITGEHTLMMSNVLPSMPHFFRHSWRPMLTALGIWSSEIDFFPVNFVFYIDPGTAMNVLDSMVTPDFPKAAA